jgi:hypothetical protein
VAVIEKGPGNHSHALGRRVVHHDRRVVADTETTGEPGKFLWWPHITVVIAGELAEAVQVNGSNDVSCCVLVCTAGVDDADVWIGEVIGEPNGVREEVGSRVGALRDGGGHSSPRPGIDARARLALGGRLEQFDHVA